MLMALRATLEANLSHWGLLDWLRLLWCMTVFWYELVSFAWALKSCSWPDALLLPSTQRPTHVLLVADPQVRDLSTSRAGGLTAARMHLTELALKRNWFFVSRNNPDVVIFLGDILVSWRSIRSDDERNYDKFVEIFRLDRRIPSYFVPGNNDVGLNIDPSAAREARRRFTTHFGPLNHKIHVDNHTLVMLDAAGLVEEDYLRAAKYIDYDHWSPLPHGPVEFVHSLREEGQRHSAILFTHIPLHRPEAASCGPLREKGTIRRGVGPSYQNMLDKKTTTFLLQSLTPEIVFSADDKDYCDYVHVPSRVIANAADEESGQATINHQPIMQNVREITIKAFSPSSEIKRPGFQLLSLTSPSSPSKPSFATAPCFLPDYPSAYPWRYTPLLLATTAALVLLRRRTLRRQPPFSSYVALPTHHTRQSLFRKSLSLSSLPPFPFPLPWSPHAHPPTPFSADWSPRSPTFQSPHSAKSTSSPTDALPAGALRAPLPLPAPSGGDAEPLQTTPMLRATAHPVPGSATSLSFFSQQQQQQQRYQLLPSGYGHEHGHGSGPAHLEADEPEDDFAYGGQTHARPLLRRGPAVVSGGGLGITFTLNGQRRRVALWDWTFFRGLGWCRVPLGAGRGRRRAFVKRVGLDLWYILWPAAVLWLGLRWLMS